MGTITKKVSSSIVKKVNKYRPMIRSRHPSHAPLRLAIERLPFRSVIRLGSLTELDDPASKAGTRIELNSRQAIGNSANKLKMKQCFTQRNVKTAQWFTYDQVGNIFIPNGVGEQGRSRKDMRYPIVAKHHFGSRGTGNYLLKSEKELEDFLVKQSRNLNRYIFEEYCNFNKEYRLHITKNGCFYSCRKMLKQEFKEHPNAWQRHDDNCVWILEENENFDKPVNWVEIVANCVEALNACGLDFGACDLRVQNNTDAEGKKRHACDFIVVEINSAPSFGAVTLEKYKVELPKLLMDKYNNK